MVFSIETTIAAIRPPDLAAMATAQSRQNQLTKPAGSLGRLESLSIQLAGITRTPRPRFRQPVVVTLAADHGIARQGISAYPSAVTGQMVYNFVGGGAAINVLARHVGARVVVGDLGVASDISALPIVHKKIGPGTRDFSVEAAMTYAEAERAFLPVSRLQTPRSQGADLIGTGDMGIGNTSAASAITAAMTGCPPRQVTGRGTGVDDATLAHKIAVIERALELHQPRASDPIGVLARVGGFEIGGLVGVMLGGAAHGVPIVMDGFISGAAALLANAVANELSPYLIPAHRSVEIGHTIILDRLGLQPLFDLDLRLGEGTGAALGISLCIAAARLLDEMATFGEAGVSERGSETGA